TQGRSTIGIKGGRGVGVVTKPGLEVAVGKPAINPGPVRMIRIALDRVLTEWRKTENQRIEVEIFAPRGEELAQKTLNARLGIDGGISILGTTGIVKPMSHDAYIATIKSGISVAAALGKRELVFTTGRRSERFAMALFPGIRQEGFVQTGDFFKASLELAVRNDSIHGVTITVFFGKAVKMAMGFPHTHAAKSELTMKTLSQWALDTTSSQGLAADIRQANTARHAFDFIHPDHPDLIACVGEKILASATQFSSNRLRIRCLILDFNGQPVFDSGTR
ncbi:MAG TPA: cobalt-precorrin-5B (C(1))-methyltransferase CbiD, partial [Desulfobacteraceae bacterium]|nr:cobalt-precorrin-5B (C(1))-methyltransferase CbiD [Desulfobacteraceae bacterium]